MPSARRARRPTASPQDHENLPTDTSLGDGPVIPEKSSDFRPLDHLLYSGPGGPPGGVLPDAGLLQGYLNYFQNSSFGTPEDHRRHMHAFRRGIAMQLEERFEADVINDWLDTNMVALKNLQDTMTGIGRRFQLQGLRLAGMADSDHFLPTANPWPIADQTMIDQLVTAMIDPAGVFDLVGTKPHQHWQKLNVERFTNIAHRLLIALKRTHAGYDFSEPVDGYALQARFDAVVDVLKGCKGTVIRLDRPTTLEEVIAHPRKMKQRFIDNQINNLKKKTGHRALPAGSVGANHLIHLQNIQAQNRHSGEIDAISGEFSDDEDVQLRQTAPTRPMTRSAKREILKTRRQRARNSRSTMSLSDDAEDSSALRNQGDRIANMEPMDLPTQNPEGIMDSSSPSHLVSQDMTSFDFNSYDFVQNETHNENGYQNANDFQNVNDFQDVNDYPNVNDFGFQYDPQGDFDMDQNQQHNGDAFNIPNSSMQYDIGFQESGVEPQIEHCSPDDEVFEQMVNWSAAAVEQLSVEDGSYGNQNTGQWVPETRH
ncbi:hypothetical protein EDC01DRAFT_628342 [Geopyxis carbonaria]|nr:hypothetical protein EDC01DRAFT_628342 [Geopyxis carbonaria]